SFASRSRPTIPLEGNMSMQAQSHPGSRITWRNAPTKRIDVGGTKLVYRQLGPDTGVPVIFLNHLAAELDRWDPRVVDGIATRRGARIPGTIERAHRESRQAGLDRGVQRPIESHTRLGASASRRSVAHSSPGSSGEW